MSPGMQENCIVLKFTGVKPLDVHLETEMDKLKRRRTHLVCSAQIWKPGSFVAKLQIHLQVQEVYEFH